MPYLKLRKCVDCEHLADLVVRKGGNYYESVERLSKQLKLNPRDKLKLKSNIRRMIEGTYLEVRSEKRQ